MNPIALELITSRKDEFIKAVEGHSQYDEYRKLADKGVNDTQKNTVKYERFLRMVDNVIFAENLRRSGQTKLVEQYEAMVAAERSTF